MKKALLFWLIAFPLFSFSQKAGQQLVDSLLIELPKMKEDTLKVAILNQLSNEYVRIDTNKGLIYAQQSLTLSKKIGWEEGMAIAYNNFGQNYYIISNYKQAFFYHNAGLKLKCSKKTKSDLFNGISIVYMSQDNLTKALEYAFSALKIRESINYTKGYAQSLSNIGGIYYNLRNTTKAITYYKKAIQADEKYNKQKANIQITRIIFNLGITYTYLKKYPEALFYLNKGLSIVKKFGETRTESKYLGAIASVYFDQKKYNLAEQNCIESLKLTNAVENVDNAYNYGLIGNIVLERAKAENNDLVLLEKAKAHLIKSSVIYKNLRDNIHIYLNNELLSEIEGLKGNYKSALDFYKQSVIYKDSVFNADNKETIKNLEDKRTIELRDNEIKINKLKLESKEKQKWYFIFGFVLLGIIGGLLLYQSNNRKKTNLKLQILNANLDQANKVKTRVLSILNHDLRSPVNSFIHYIQFKKESPELLDEAAKNRIENSTVASAKNLLNSMEDILLWTKDQMENFEPQPKNVLVSSLFEDTKNHFSNEKNVKITFENFQNIGLNTDDNYLKTIIRNLTGNALKALIETENPIIIWKAYSENNKNYLSITDNGKGGTEEQFKALFNDAEVSGIQSGLGLHLIRDLAKAINCEISIDTKVNKGTTFTLIL